MNTPQRLHRRTLFQAVAGSSAVTALRQQDLMADGPPADVIDQAPVQSIQFRLNGAPQSVTVDCRTTLVDLLREDLQMVGTKKGCDHGSCGACTVHVNGKRVLSCLTLAATLEGKDVRTIEGVSAGETLHPVQEAFLRCDAYQCGYCTPGQIMSAVACIDEGHASGDVEETREWMSGNLCRCSAYPNITAAVRQAAGTEPPRDPAADVTVIRDAKTKAHETQESGANA